MRASHDAAERGATAVLAVDDYPLNLLALAAVLEPLGITVETAADGREALQKAEDRTFAAILLDVMMPEMDGFETLHRLRKLKLLRPHRSRCLRPTSLGRTGWRSWTVWGPSTTSSNPSRRSSSVARWRRSWSCMNSGRRWRPRTVTLRCSPTIFRRRSAPYNSLRATSLMPARRIAPGLSQSASCAARSV